MCLKSKYKRIKNYFFILLFFFLYNNLFSLDDVTLQLRWDHQFQFAGYYAALWQGYYEDAGLNVTIKSALSEDGQILSATREVSEGSAQFGVGAADILVANDQGADLVVSAVIFQQSAAAFYALDETIMDHPINLTSLKVARNINDLIDIELQAMLRNEGIDPKSIKAYPHQSGNQHLLSGKVDVVPGYIFSFPYELDVNDIKYKILKPRDSGVDFYGDSLFTSKEYVNNHAENVEKFTEATLKGWEYAFDNSEEMALNISKNLKRTAFIDDILGFNLFQSAGVRELSFYPIIELGHINPYRWEKMFFSLKESGLVENEFIIDEFIFDPDRLKEIATRKTRNTLNIIALILSVTLLISVLFIYILRKSVKLQTERLLNSEKRYRIIAENFPNGYLAIIERDFSISFISGQGMDSINPKDLFNKKVELKSLFGDKTTIVQDKLKESFNGKQHQIEIALNNEFLLLKMMPVISNSKQYDNLVLVCANITEQKKKESLKKAKWRFIDYAKDHTVLELLQFFLDEAELITGSSIGFYHFLEEDQKTLSLQTWSSNTIKSMCQTAPLEKHYPVSKAGVWVDCIHERKPVIHNDYETLKHKKGLPEGHAPIQREMVVPVIRNNLIVAVLGVGNKKTGYTEQDIESVQQMADLAWETIQSKRAEEELMESLSEKKRLLSAIEQSKDTIVITDPNGIIIYINPNFEKTTGYSKNEILGQNMNILKSNIQDSQFYSELWDKINNKETWIGQIVNKKKDTSLFTEDVSITPVLDENGEIINFVSVQRDITTKLKLQRERRDLQDQLNQRSKVDAIGQMAGGMAHDFNNVLSGIVSAAQLLKSPNTMTNEKREKYIDLILEASQRGEDLTSKLLSYGHKGDNIFENVDLIEILQNTIEILKRTIDKKISIQLENVSGKPVIWGDKFGLENIFINMGINASHAMTGEGLLVFRVNNLNISDSNEFDLEAGNYCQIEIHDNGCGIPENVINQIFEPFYTTKDIERGTGLGLAVVKNTVDEHHGTISVESTIGLGSSFNILLPLSEEKILPKVSENKKVVHGKGCILFVDDEELNRVTGNEILASFGYDVLLAENGEEALSIFSDNSDKIKLVLLDMVMPVMNGAETFHKLKEISPECKIIISSGYTNNEDVDALLDAGLSGFIHKPYRMAELSKMINNLIN